jgi:hypothetical protein
MGQRSAAAVAMRRRATYAGTAASNPYPTRALTVVPTECRLRQFWRNDDLARGLCDCSAS